MFAQSDGELSCAGRRNSGRTVFRITCGCGVPFRPTPDRLPLRETMPCLFCASSCRSHASSCCCVRWLRRRPNGRAIRPAIWFWPMATAYEQVQPKMVATGDGGFYVSWFDSNNGYSVYLQRLSAAGVEQWAHNGLLVAARNFTSTQDYGLAIDPRQRAADLPLQRRRRHRADPGAEGRRQWHLAMGQPRDLSLRRCQRRQLTEDRQHRRRQCGDWHGPAAMAPFACRS